MYCRFIVRSIQGSDLPLFVNRSLSLTSFQLAATTKSKEKPLIKEESTTNLGQTKIEGGTDVSKTPTKPIIPPPTSGVNDPNKTYSDKIHRLVEEISRLSLVDVMDLNELLKKTLKIQDVPIMVTSGTAGGGGAPVATKKEEDDDEGSRPTAQSVFKVRLIKIDETKKVPIIKQVKDVMENVNLVQAKKLVESVPQILRDNMSKADAEAIKAKIEAAGGVCVIE